MGLTGTGLAHPKTSTPSPADLNIKHMTGTKIVPTKSMCLIGLKLSLPNLLAVSSPRAKAASP